MKEKEIRKLDIQLRAENLGTEEDEEEQEMVIKGYAAVFDSPENYGYTEVIAQSAFDEADMSDVVLRYNHNDSYMVLARTRNKSLQLEVDKENKHGKRGLYMEAHLQNDITAHRDVYNGIISELLDKQSFAITVEEDTYDYETDTRTITKIGKLFDVSVVDQPFYNATDVSASRDINNNEFLERRAEIRKQHEDKKALDEAKRKLIEKLG